MKNKKIKFLLVSTNKGYGGNYIPFGVFILDSYISKKLGSRIDIKIADQNCDDLMAVYKNFNPEIVGISFSTITFNIARDLAKQIKEENPKVIILVGGPHVSAVPEFTLNYDYFDIGFIGEAEKSLTEFFRRFLKNNKITFSGYKNIPGIILKTKDSIYKNQKLDYIQNIDEIPYMNFKKLNLENYLRKNQMIRALKPLRTFAVMTTRGCPYNCFFCASSVVSNRNVRFNSAEYVINYIKLLYKKFKIEGIYFHDDLFIANKERIKKICQGLIDCGLSKKIKWACQVRTEVVLNSKDILNLIREAGCVQFEFGFESGNDRVLKLLKGKTASVENNQKALDLVTGHGIKVFGNFMIANYSETKKETYDTLNFIKKNLDKLNFYYVNAAYPLPGTAWWKEEKFDLRNFEYDRLADNDINPKSYCKYWTDTELKVQLNKINLLAYNHMSLKAKTGWLLDEIFTRPSYVLFRIVHYFKMAKFAYKD